MLPKIVDEFLAGVQALDAARVARCFTEDGTYHFLVPKPPVQGRAAIEAAFSRVLGEVNRTRWDVITSGVSGDRVYLERIDRFWYGEHEAAMQCLGVFELRGEQIDSVRDYADHETWTLLKRQALGGSN